MADSGPSSGLLATYLRLLAQVTSASSSLLPSSAPSAMMKIRRAEHQPASVAGLEGGGPRRFADDLNTNGDVGLLVAMAQHRHLARLSRADAADTTRVLRPLLEKLDGAGAGVVEAIPELVQFPVFTRELPEARALLEGSRIRCAAAALSDYCLQAEWLSAENVFDAPVLAPTTATSYLTFLLCVGRVACLTHS